MSVRPETVGATPATVAREEGPRVPRSLRTVIVTGRTICEPPHRHGSR